MQTTSRVLARRTVDLKGALGKGIAYLLLSILAVSTVFPFVWMISTSFKQEQYVFDTPPQLIPDPWEFGNYVHLFTSMPFGLYIYNSFKIAILSVIGNVLVSSLAAYSFARLRFWGKEVIFLVLLGTMMLPGYVTMIPIYLIMYRIGWINTHEALWVPSFFGGAWSIFLIRQYLLSLPQELMDASRIDGCSHLGVFYRVVLPLAKPVLATLALLTFMGNWNALLGPVMYLNSDSKMTLTVALTRFRGIQYTYVAKTMAGSTVSLIPMLILFMFTQKYFVQSVTMTGLKG